MKLLNEVIRIKKLMNINEASNPIYDLFMEPFITKAWRAFKDGFENSAMRIGQYLDNNLDNTSIVTLRDLSKSKGNINAGSMNVNDLIDDLLSRAATMTDDELKILTKKLSTIPKFSDSIFSAMKDDDSFKLLFKDAIELEGAGYLTPQQIKNVLNNYLGEVNASKLYDEMRVPINPKKILDTELIDEFTLPPSTISGLISATEDKTLQSTLSKILEPTTLKSILEKAEGLSKTTKIDSVWFKKEFEQIVNKNPSFWTQLKRGEFNKIFNKLYSEEKSGNFSIKVLGKNIAKTMAVGGATYVIASVIAAVYTADDLIEAWKGECMSRKGYTKENKETIKKDNLNKYTQDNADCDIEVNKKETSYDLKSFLSWYPDVFGLLKKDVGDVDASYLSTGNETTTYIDELTSFQKYMNDNKIANSLTAKEQGSEITGIGYKTYIGNGLTYKFCKGNFITSNSECK